MTSSDTADTSDENGTATRLAEEIRLLVDLVADHAAPWLEGVLDSEHGDPSGEREHEGERQGGGCTWCPLCAVVAVARGERPELAVRVLDQLAQLAALLRAVLADRWEPHEGVHMPGFQPGPRSAPEPAGTPRVQHVAVRPRQDWEQQER